MLEDIIKLNKELRIQKYLEEHPLILRMGIGVAEWAFNYVLPQFMLGCHFCADFIVLTGQSNSYEVTIVELKRPETSLYNQNGTLAKDFNLACTRIDDYRRWIKDNTNEFKRDLVKRIKEQNPSFEENFDWTRRFRIFSTVVIGRRANLSKEHQDKNNDMEDKGVKVISYDRLIDVERRLSEMLEKGIDLNYFDRDYWIRKRYNIELENKKPDRDSIGTDNVLFLGDEEREYGNYGFYKDMLERAKAIMDHNQMMLDAEQRGAERINKLNTFLIHEKRYEDLERSTRDKEFQKQLMSDYGI